MPDTDAELALQAKAGNQAALSELLKRYHGPLFATAMRAISNRDDALDVLQDACIRILGSIGTLHDTKLFYPWARNIVRNLALDRLRGRKRVQQKREHIVAREAARVSGSDKAELLYNQVLQAIQELPDEYHVPLFCRYLEEISYQQIALRTGRSVDSIRGLLYRGTRMLRDSLNKYFENQD